MKSELKPSKILLVCLGFNANMRNTKKIGVDILENIFSSYGQLSKILIFSKKNLLKAFVEFEDLESSSKAVEALNNAVLPVHGKLTAYYSSVEHVEIENDIWRFKVMNAIFLFTKFLYFLHGMSNPIIYNLMSTKFNRSFRNVVLCKSIHSNKNQHFLRQVSFSQSHKNKVNSIKYSTCHQNLSLHDSYG